MAAPQQEFADLAATRMAAAPTPKAASLIAQNSATVNLPQTATRADEQIMRGLTVLLLAIAAASGLAVWRRRVRGVFAGAKRNDR
jgi:Ca-activated chloride channel family protein